MDDTGTESDSSGPARQDFSLTLGRHGQGGIERLH